MAPPKSPPPLPTQVDSAVDDPERLYSKYEAAQARNPILQKDYLLNRDDTSRNDDLSTTKLGTAQPLQDNTEDILRIIPANLEARKAFDTVARLVKKGALHQHHERYLQITGQGPVGQDVKRAPRDSDETTDEAVNDLDLTMVYEGFFRLCFSLPTVHQGSVWVQTYFIRRICLFPLTSFLVLSKIQVLQHLISTIGYWKRLWPKIWTNAQRRHPSGCPRLQSCFWS